MTPRSFKDVFIRGNFSEKCRMNFFLNSFRKVWEVVLSSTKQLNKIIILWLFCRQKSDFFVLFFWVCRWAAKFFPPPPGLFDEKFSAQKKKRVAFTEWCRRAVRALFRSILYLEGRRAHCLLSLFAATSAE